MVPCKQLRIFGKVPVRHVQMHALAVRVGRTLFTAAVAVSLQLIFDFPNLNFNQGAARTREMQQQYQPQAQRKRVSALLELGFQRHGLVIARGPARFAVKKAVDAQPDIEL